jgi:hypothetical protein
VTLPFTAAGVPTTPVAPPVPVPPTPQPPIGLVDFTYLSVRAGGSDDGARDLFERLISQLVTLIHRNVRRIRANPGDAGLDTIVGELDGVISVWQSKYFPRALGPAQQAQVRESLKSATDNAVKGGYQIDAWTLCVPCNLDPAEAKWWDGFKRKKQREHGIQITMWDATELERRLLSRDAEQIFHSYFYPPGVAQSLPDRPVEELPSPNLFDDALFVAQLRAANFIQLTSAKREFFNAEILGREVTDKGVPEEVETLFGLRATYYALWERDFNNVSAACPDAILPGLHRSVMEAIQRHSESTRPSPLRAGLVHSFGMMHQLVDDGEAGWVRHYQGIAATHGR